MPASAAANAVCFADTRKKTGNAIRALGRMATLSASRRNSAIAMGASNSPRPSISGLSMLGAAHVNNTQMASLNEEEDDFSVDMPQVEKRKAGTGVLKLRDKSQCSERSDSGYSECSNGSIGAQETLLLTLAKTKLEQIAKTKRENVDTFSGQPALELPAKGEPIMLSDFTNTIKMRKKSLEDSCAREKLKPHAKPIFDSKLKVSQLKHKFQQSNAAAAAALNKPPTNRVPIAKVPSVGHISKCKILSDSMPYLSLVINTLSPPISFCAALPEPTRSAVSGSSSKTKPTHTQSMPSSPLPQRSATPTRLSSRIRETTERLAQQHTVSSAQRYANGNGNGKGNSNGNGNDIGHGLGQESRARSLINRFNETKHIKS